jgi:hypothetical protein
MNTFRLDKPLRVKSIDLETTLHLGKAVFLVILYHHHSLVVRKEKHQAGFYALGSNPNTVPSIPPSGCFARDLQP